MNDQHFSVIVVGGGHAGTEAALAAARMGERTLLLTQQIETIGQMSCNPAIGGIGKSHLVREIDALDGIMARATDLAGIHFRTLNTRKGPAVRAIRAQTDRALYKAAIRQFVEHTPQLFLFQQGVADLIVRNDKVCGVVTDMGVQFYAMQVILTTGTFLAGTIHIGTQQQKGGRAGDAPTIRLAERLRELHPRVGRLKTGTPPRLDRRSLDFTQMREQPGDEPLPVMSYIGKTEQHPSQCSCFIAKTNARTHDIVRAALGESPLYTGIIEGIGPRYCPSIEDKVVRFSDKPSHQVFIEPEGIDSHEIYPNGISTSLPYQAQCDLVRSIAGFERAHITRPGYAIEYDFFDPRDLQLSLESRVLKGLFFAGQINGTTGYEEAAAQGLLAAINAVLRARNKDAWYPLRNEAYLGVLIDDLITRGVTEPYRMFTSRAEYRLLLRQDNADRRLTPIGRELGVVGDDRWRAYLTKRQECVAVQEQFARVRVSPSDLIACAVADKLSSPLTQNVSLLDLLKRPEVSYADICAHIGVTDERDIAEHIEAEIKYAGYIEHQEAEAAKLRAADDIKIPHDMDYTHLSGLSNEVKEKLHQTRPDNFGCAGRIPGMTPAALSILAIHVKKYSARHSVHNEFPAHH